MRSVRQIRIILLTVSIQGKFPYQSFMMVKKGSKRRQKGAKKGQKRGVGGAVNDPIILK